MLTTGGKKRANLRDVAKMAGVSVATVSRVLNSPGSVTERTRARVLVAIDELRFVPSAAARAINSGRTRIVGALIPTLDNAIFARFLDAVERHLAPHQLSLIVATTNGDAATEREKAQNLVDIGAEGLIVSGIHHSQEFLDLVTKNQLPVIVTSYFDAQYRLPTIGYDNRVAARVAARHLFDLGHTEIAVIHGPRRSNDRTSARIAGIEEAELMTKLVFHEVDLSVAGGCAAVQALVASGESVSAILCLSDVLAMGALFELDRAGLKVPLDISVMGIDDLPGSSFTAPALTSVHLPVQEMGAQAAKALSAWIEMGQVPDPVALSSNLVVRHSTAKNGNLNRPDFSRDP